jgi:hypothetical protein
MACGSTVRQGALRDRVVASRQIAHEGNDTYVCKELAYAYALKIPV